MVDVIYYLNKNKIVINGHSRPSSQLCTRVVTAYEFYRLLFPRTIIVSEYGHTEISSNVSLRVLYNFYQLLTINYRNEISCRIEEI